MTVPAFVKVDGNPGEAKGKGVDGMIEVYSFEHDVQLPTDLRDGSVTGRRQHGFFTILKELDQCTPVFAKHLCDNLKFPSVEVNMYRPDADTGDIVHYFTVKMTDVKVISQQISKRNTCDPESKPFRDFEEIRFAYAGINWADKKGNEYFDSWELG